MATTESAAMIERWKAEHPDLATGAPAAPPRPPRPAPSRASAPASVPPTQHGSPAERREMIERWQREHAERTRTPPPPSLATATTTDRAYESDRRVFELDSTPLSILSAFIVGCILGGIAMTIITGIAFWGFSGG